ncbi:MAG: ferredoxin--NADP reductase [Gammaproteobacteria bacterium]
MSKWVEGKVVGHTRWTDTLYSLHVDAPIDPFKAGQFTRLALEIDGKLEPRPYSLVNAPDERPLEFYFITVPGGPLTTHLIALRPGDPIMVAPKATGLMVIADLPPAENLWLLSTGTAIGPFLSILKTAEPWQCFKKIVLVHAVRSAAELSFQELIQSLRTEHGDQFVMIPFVSREDTDYALKARVPQTIADGRLEGRAGIELRADNSQVMICGNPDMVKETAATLEARGLKKHKRRDPGQITVENYW